MPTRANVADESDDGSRACDEQQPGTQLKALAVRAACWTLGWLVVGQCLRLVSNAILSRLLYPGAFGIMAIVHLCLRALQMFSDAGVHVNIIRDPDGDTQAFRDTAWTILVVRGFALWVVAALLAIPAARFYGEPQLAYLLPVVGLTAVITGFRSTAVSTLNRRLAVAKLSIFRLSCQAAGLATMVLLAYVWRSVWALAAGAVVGAIATSIGSHFLDGTKNRFAWDTRAAHTIFHFGKWVFLGSIISFVAAQMDRIILGKCLTMEQFGVYHIAATLAVLPMVVADQLCNVVLVPVFSEQTRVATQKLESRVLAARRVLLTPTMFGSLVIVFLGPLFFALVYDDRYADAQWLVGWVVIPTWFSILMRSSRPALLAVGDTRSLMLANLVFFLLGATGCVLGYTLAGLSGFVIGLALGPLSGELVMLAALRHYGLDLFGQDCRFCAALAVAGLLGTSGLLGIISTDPSNPGMLGPLVLQGIILLVVGVVSQRLLSALLFASTGQR